ncbi:MAG: hypothetical protein KAU41_08980, partial [Deltaproteobacteria bacterium]|nr:hypothetical protein [Deltaproteobacteria bacterium]
MIGIQRISINFFIMFVMCLVVLLVNGITYAADGKYPIKVAIIEKDQATYDTPENALAAMCSSSIREDLEWYYETLTEETALEDKKAFQEAGIDPRKESEVFRKYFKEAYIIDKHIYGHSIILVVDIHTTSGTIFTLPYTFVEEHNKWKMTNKFAGDEDLWEYLDYIKPEEIISSTTIIRPNRWNLNWYNWIKEHIEERKWIR